jgi:hypothetical protein
MENEQKQVATKIPCWWMKNAKGVQSVSVTLLVVAFVVTTLMYIASAFVKLGPIEMRPFDVGACSVYFIPIASLYFGRRYTTTKFEQSTKDTI